MLEAGDGLPLRIMAQCARSWDPSKRTATEGRAAPASMSSIPIRVLVSRTPVTGHVPHFFFRVKHALDPERTHGLCTASRGPVKREAATAEDFTPFSPRQLTARRKAIKEAGDDPAVQAIYAQVPALQDMLGVDLQVDHIWPIAKGGEHVARNLQIVPKDVNLRKNDKWPYKYEAD